MYQKHPYGCCSVTEAVALVYISLRDTGWVMQLADGNSGEQKKKWLVGVHCLRFRLVPVWECVFVSLR